jgi:hypothetical protein
MAPRWNEHFKFILDDPMSQTLQLWVADYSALAENAQMRHLESGIAKMSTAGRCRLTLSNPR